MTWRDFLETSLQSSVVPLKHDLFAESPGLYQFGEITENTALDELQAFSGKSKVFLNRTHHRVLSRVLFISKRFLERLPRELRVIVNEEGIRAAKNERRLSIEDGRMKMQALRSRGVTVMDWSREKRAQERERFVELYREVAAEDPDAIAVVDSLNGQIPAVTQGPVKFRPTTQR